MNLIQQSGENPLVSQSFGARSSAAIPQSMPNDILSAQTYTRPYQSPDGLAPQGWAAAFRGRMQSLADTSGAVNAGGDQALPLPGLASRISGSAGAQGGFLGLINSLINQLGALINQYNGEANAEGAGIQTVGDGTFASTGDPHLSQTGSVLDASGKASSVDRHFDSMASHDNLLSSQDFNGGYRLSTTVSAPNAKGATVNSGATVHANSDLDNITLRSDGSCSILSNGSSVSLNAGQSMTLGGGEQVTRNPDGSLTVLEQNAFGGSIATRMEAKGGGVDVTALVHNTTVGGDIPSGSADPVTTQLPTDGMTPLSRNRMASGFA